MSDVSAEPAPDPSTDPVTDPGIPDLLVVTPWYPTDGNAYSGTFVRESVRCLRPFYSRIVIVHVENVPVDDRRPPSWSDTPEGPVLWIGARMNARTSREGMILAQRRALATHAQRYLTQSPTIHCHVGAPTAAALVSLIPDTARLVVTEHATYLPRIFANPDARELYRHALARADRFIAVSETTARYIDRTFPGSGRGVRVVANPVRFDDLPVRRAIDPALKRWLYVGNLVEHKGVRRLVRAFAAWCGSVGEDPSSQLTIVGDGVVRRDLERLAAELGVGERVRFHGPADPDEIGTIYAEHDLLVHLSHVETFGLTSVEAAASGLAVVATRSGGPEHTLVLHRALGLARFVDVAPEDDVSAVVEAVRSLRRSVRSEALAPSRDHLVGNYGDAAIGAELFAALSNTPPPVRVPTPGLRALVVALTGAEILEGESTMRDLTDFGGGGMFLAGRGGSRRVYLPASVSVADDSSHPWLTRIGGREAERLHAWSEVGYRVAWRGTRLLGRVHPGIASRSLRVVEGVRRRATRAIDDPSSAPVRALRTVRAVAARQRFAGLGPGLPVTVLEGDAAFGRLDWLSFDHLVVPNDALAPVVTIALQRNPALVVHRRWSRSEIAETFVRVARPELA